MNPAEEKSRERQHKNCASPYCVDEHYNDKYYSKFDFALQGNALRLQSRVTPGMRIMSSKSVVQKLGIKKGQRLLIVGAPAGYSPGALPPDSRMATTIGEADVAQIFVFSKKELEQNLLSLKKELGPVTALWVTYPKGAAKTKSDLNRDVIREYAATVGLEAVSIFAVDETWSALRLKRTQVGHR
jgi:hypothetical protein